MPLLKVDLSVAIKKGEVKWGEYKILVGSSSLPNYQSARKCLFKALVSSFHLLSQSGTVVTAINR